MIELDQRPRAGRLVVPFVVDETRHPIDFRENHMPRIRACADHRLCGICGGRIEIYERLAFIGPRTLMERACFADPWMHEECGRIAMEQCPFLSARKDWREPADDQRSARLLKPYSRDMLLRTAPAGRAHKDGLGSWHFEAMGPLREVA